jgi:hypothetical protein
MVKAIALSAEDRLVEVPGYLPARKASIEFEHER